MSYVTGLKCKECGKEYKPEVRSACDECFGPVEVTYDLDAIARQVQRGRIDQRRKTLWRYSEFLPIENERNVIDIHAGYTPLKRCDNLAKALGLRPGHLYVKDDSTNPTGSFKDRPTSVAISKAKEWSMSAVGCASTGNLAGATAAVAARAGLPRYVFIPQGLDKGKVATAQLYGAKVIAIDGTYDEVNRIANLVADKKKWGLVNINIRPYYVEGSKTITFETVEQLFWKAPDRIIIPLGSGALLASANKALRELEGCGWIQQADTKICGTQPDGCAPIAHAAMKGTEDIKPVEKPNTIADSLAIGDPASGLESLRVIKKTGGWGDAPSDHEIVDAQLLLAKTEGMFSEPAGGCVIASLKRKIAAGQVGRDEIVVAYITGSGLKALKSVEPKLAAVANVPNDFAKIEAVLAA